MQQLASGGELLIAGGVADEMTAHLARRTLNLRGHDEPIDAFVHQA
jgi:adenylate cyclase